MAKREDMKPMDDEFSNRLIAVNRVTKVVKGGRNMRFSALVVVGDGKGQVGLGMGKAAEVPIAIEKAIAQAKRNLHGTFGRGNVLMMPAPDGTGVIAGGPVRAVLEVAGIKNIRTKSHGTNNPINCAKAALQGLKDLKSAERVAALRGKTVEEILG